jgi:hypothetical protein
MGHVQVATHQGTTAHALYARLRAPETAETSARLRGLADRHDVG